MARGREDFRTVAHLEAALRCRAWACSADTQKLSKQAIYCLHRGDFDGAAAKLQKAQEAAEKLKGIVEAEPSLRMGGSYSNSLEEARFQPSLTASEIAVILGAVLYSVAG